MTLPQNPIRQTIVLDDTVYETTLTKKFSNRKPYVPRDTRQLTAIIPGLVLEPISAPGDRVPRGKHLLILEAMKMQNFINAPDDVTVKSVHVTPGDIVAKGQLLMEFV